MHILSAVLRTSCKPMQVHEVRSTALENMHLILCIGSSAVKSGFPASMVNKYNAD